VENIQNFDDCEIYLQLAVKNNKIEKQFFLTVSFLENFDREFLFDIQLNSQSKFVVVDGELPPYRLTVEL
jgi:hypothetical protein